MSADNGATAAPTVTTEPDGTAVISVTSQTAGTSTVTVTINNSSQSQNVTFVPGEALQLSSTIETTKSSYTVGETITITVTLRDAFDNLVTGATSQLADNGVLTVGGTDPSETGSWVESGGVYTTTRMATIAGNGQHASLQLQSWSDGVTSDRYDIQSGSPAQATSAIATDKNAYTAGETITVAVTLKDAYGNQVKGGESLLSGDNVTVEGAVRAGEWSETAGVYSATWVAQMAGESHHATLTLSEWEGSKQSESYSIHSGAPVQANSAIRTDKTAYIAGDIITVTVVLKDVQGNFVTDGAAQLNPGTVIVRNADFSMDDEWTYIANGRYQRPYISHVAGVKLHWRRQKTAAKASLHSPRHDIPYSFIVETARAGRPVQCFTIACDRGTK